jgi:hypothetical protein
MLAEKAKASGLQDYENMVSSFEDELVIWADHIQSRKNEFDRWDYKGRFWEIISHQGARPTGRTIQFIKEWLQMALSPTRAQRIAGDDYARKWIYERERQLKRKLARLDNPEALARWSRDASQRMAGQLRYRWRPAETIISDILLGIGRS